MSLERTNPTTAVDAAFAAFYEAELGSQVRRAAALLGSGEAANDVVHDAMVSLYRRWADVRDPAAYLSTAVLNGCRDAGRRRRTADSYRHRLVTDAAVDVAPDPLDDLFDRLPFQQRAAVVLRFYEGLSYGEIASVLGCPEGSVGPWIDRALRSLKEQLS